MAQIRDISKRTALYERLSKDDEQQGESNSILNQKQYLEEYAHKNGFVNIQHFTDDGYTGRNFNRPGFQEMLAEIENGKIGTVIVKDMSRFGRNYLQVGFYTEIMFPQKQVRFIAINNSVDSDKPQDNDFTPFLNIMNEWYAKDTSNKIKSIFLSRMNDGKRCSGSIPYGYNRLPGDKQTLVVDPVASKVVKHIFALAADGYNPPTIAKKLTEEEVLIPSAYTLQYHPEQCNREAKIKAEQELAEKERLRKERAKKSNEAFQKRAMAARWAANDGHKFPKRVCEYCGKEFYPNGSRQKYCGADCLEAHGKAEAEKRRNQKKERRYPQRNCKICGKAFWPSHSQEILCSKECKIINYNRNHLAYYHRKQSEKKAKSKE